MSKDEAASSRGAWSLRKERIARDEGMGKGNRWV